MAEPLRKRKAGGELYRRRGEVEALIDRLGHLPRDELIERMCIASPTHPDFLPSECLLHFVRKSKRDNSSRQFELMYKALIARVERAATVSGAVHFVEGKRAITARAAKIIEAVVFAFEVKLTQDRNGYCDGLDYFEINFASAMKLLRSTARTKIDTEEDRERPLSYNDEEAISAEVEAAAGSFDPFNPRKIDDPVYRSALGVAINELPAEEREVVVLMLKGYPIDSKEPNATTIRSVLGCSEKTVRNRRDRALAKLRRALEDLE
ncbi:RNA polymerase sigma factor [Chelatococcus sp. GCM10030263]|uniref:RNA polymerase sigma factor n=1 Tax=Chelatococcus sp. GCM10030263 TaxID=3273387 RepID=UPI00361C58F9